MVATYPIGRGEFRGGFGGSAPPPGSINIGFSGFLLL